MASAVQNLQNAILSGSKPITQLLREAKVIAGKLGLEDVEAWVTEELKSYSAESKVPEYRMLRTSHLEVFNPYRGWQYAGSYECRLPIYQSVHDLEALAASKDISITLTKRIPVRDQYGNDTTSEFEQRLCISPSEVKGVLQAIHDELLEWTSNFKSAALKVTT